MKASDLRELFDAQLKAPLGTDIVPGTAANDPLVEEPRVDDHRLFFYSIEQSSTSSLTMLAIWKSELREFSSKVKQGSLPRSNSVFPYLTL